MRRVSRFSVTRTEDEDIKKIKQLKFKRDSQQLSQVNSNKLHLRITLQNK